MAQTTHPTIEIWKALAGMWLSMPHKALPILSVGWPLLGPGALVASRPACCFNSMRPAWTMSSSGMQDAYGLLEQALDLLQRTKYNLHSQTYWARS